MLKKITIKNVATYDSKGIEIRNLNKVNFIYGANGSGKTTISKYISNAEREGYQDCYLEWVDDNKIHTYVYNKEFRENNFGKSDIAGIFTLGKATIEEVEKIQTKREILVEIKNKGIQKKNTIEEQKKKLVNEEERFKEIVWKEIYKKYEVVFKEAFKGALTKEAFKGKLLDVAKNPFEKPMTYNELNEKAKTIFGELPVSRDLIKGIDDKTITVTEEDENWNHKVIGKQDVGISQLIQWLKNSDWVNEGRKYITESDICPFCQQATITDEFKKCIEEFFDEEFEQQILKLNNSKDKFIKFTAQALAEIGDILSQEKNLQSKSRMEVDKLELLVKSFSMQIESNKIKIDKKLKEPSISIDLEKTTNIIANINELIKDANDKICEDNRIAENYPREKSILIGDIWGWLAREYKSFIDEYLKQCSGLKKGINKLEEDRKNLLDEYNKLDKEIKKDSQNITSVQPSVDEINKLLKAYGFTNFVIVPSSAVPNHYQIQREDGSLAESTLSEGEVTFITFLYFLQLTKGSLNDQNVTDERILVIDDPISSLDSGVLFLVSTLLKEIIKDVRENKSNIKQVIVLTHNVYFHKELSFFGYRKDERRDIYFWILRKMVNVTNIEFYESKNPISSSYELLWKELNEVNRNSGITIQNIMRRIIENYFKVLGKYEDDDLIYSFSDAESQRICRSLLCWVNDGSHCMPDDLFIEFPMDTIDRYYDVFREIFKKMGQIEHYNMMMDGVRRSA